MPALWAGALVAFDGALGLEFRTASARAGLLRVVNLVEVAAAMTHQHVGRVPRIFSQRIAGEKVEPLPASRARPRLDPHEIFNIGIRAPGDWAAGLVKVAETLLQVLRKPHRRLLVGC